MDIAERDTGESKDVPFGGEEDMMRKRGKHLKRHEEENDEEIIWIATQGRDKLNYERREEDGAKTFPTSHRENSPLVKMLGRQCQGKAEEGHRGDPPRGNPKKLNM